MTDAHKTSSKKNRQIAIAWLTSVKADSPDQQQRGMLLAALLLVFMAVSAVLTIAGGVTQRLPLLEGFVSPGRTLGAVLFVVFLAIYLANRFGRTSAAGMALGITLFLFSFIILANAGPMSMAAALIILPIILIGLFGPPLSAPVLTAVTLIAYFLLAYNTVPDYLQNMVSGGRALQTSLVYFNIIVVGIVTWLYASSTRQALQESRELSLALVAQREDTLRQLSMQTRHLQATIAVARAIVGARDLSQLLDDAVNLIRETFDYYHVQVFMTDEDKGYAVLRQSTGEVGRQLLARGHKLPVGSMSVIGQVTSGGAVVIARDTDRDAVHRRNELLPDTRSEMALPLRVGDEVIGALDLQSTEPDAFNEAVIPVLQAMTDQLAIAIQNARLFEQAEDNLRELREMGMDSSRRSWAEFLQDIREEQKSHVYGIDQPGMQVQRSRVIERVLQSGSVLMSTGSDGQVTYLAVPVVVRNQVVGVLGVEPERDRQWTNEDLQIMEGIAERAALAVENARLYMQAQRAAQRERMITSIADRLQRAPTLEMLLQSAADELAAVLGTDNVYAELSVSRPLSERRKAVSADDDETVLEEGLKPKNLPAPEQPDSSEG